MAGNRFLSVQPYPGILRPVMIGESRMQEDDRRDVAFDILANLVEFTFKRNLPRTSLKIEAALDTFLEETGRASGVEDSLNRQSQWRCPDVPWSRRTRATDKLSTASK